MEDLHLKLTGLLQKSVFFIWLGYLGEILYKNKNLMGSDSQIQSFNLYQRVYNSF